MPRNCGARAELNAIRENLWYGRNPRWQTSCVMRFVLKA